MEITVSFEDLERALDISLEENARAEKLVEKNLTARWYMRERELMFCPNDGNLFSVTKEQYMLEDMARGKAGLIPPVGITGLMFIEENFYPAYQYVDFTGRIVYLGFGKFRKGGDFVIRVTAEEAKGYKCTCENVPKDVIRIKLTS